MQKIRVGVIMGGMSVEREVSFNSGRTVCDHLDTSLYTIIPLFQNIQGMLFILPWHFLHRGKISDFEPRLMTEAQRITWHALKNHIDIMYIATHGRYAEDGRLQGILEVLGIPYLGSKVFASAVRMDKIMHKKMLQAAGINVARGITVTPVHIMNFDQYQEQILHDMSAQEIAFPCIVKPHHEGSSLGVRCVEREDELYEALYNACTINPGYHQAVLIEEKLVGMEFSCITLTDYTTNTLLPLPPTEIVPEDCSMVYDYEQKYMPGRATKYTPARCSQEQINLIQEICMRVMGLLEFSTMSRIDGFLTSDNRVVIIDPNTLSGMGPASFIFLQAAHVHMSHTNLINHLIKTELYAYGMLNDTIREQQKVDAMISPLSKIRVAVLMGGDSNEREISLESGRNVVYKLSPEKYEPLPIFVTQEMQLYPIDQRLLVLNSTKEIMRELEESQQVSWDDLSNKVDFVFIALHGGKGENGCVQGALEMLGLPYNGSGVLATALCLDKYKTNEYLRNQGFEVPASYLIDKVMWQDDSNAELEKALTQLTLPVIIKPHDDGCSVMVKKATSRQELLQAVQEIFEHEKNYALVEECIVGTELTVGVIGNDHAQALPPSQVVARAGILSIEEKFLPGAGENQTPALLPQETIRLVQKTMERVYETVGCKGYVRIDCFYQTAQQSPTGHERVVILEINSLPGLTPATCIFHQAAELGIKPMDFIDRIIELGFQEHAKLSQVHGYENMQREQGL